MTTSVRSSGNRQLSAGSVQYAASSKQRAACNVQQQQQLRAQQQQQRQRQWQQMSLAYFPLSASLGPHLGWSRELFRLPIYEHQKAPRT